jgi:hypothetical protein
VTFAQGKQQAVDVLVGSNKDEGTFPFFGLQPGNAPQFIANARARFGDLADTFLKLYPAGSDAEARTSRLAAFRDELSWQMRTWAELQARLGRAKAYVFYFTHEPPAAQVQQSLGATHTAEIPHVFLAASGWRAWSDLDRKLADTMSSYWVNFAMTGDPNAGGLGLAGAFREKATSQAMVLDSQTERKRGPIPPAQPMTPCGPGRNRTEERVKLPRRALPPLLRALVRLRPLFFSPAPRSGCSGWRNCPRDRRFEHRPRAGPSSAAERTSRVWSTSSDRQGHGPLDCIGAVRVKRSTRRSVSGFAAFRQAPRSVRVVLDHERIALPVTAGITHLQTQALADAGCRRENHARFMDHFVDDRHPSRDWTIWNEFP